MKTHELATALNQLAKMLRSQPNIEMSLFGREFLDTKDSPSNQEVALGLSTLVALSRIDKQQWIGLIQDYNFPIEIRPRDASRDILGKLFRFLEKNEMARRKLSEKAREDSTKASPELLRALDVLLK